MARIRRLPYSHWFVAAMLLALAQWVVAPAAQAACGDYVMIGGHSTQHTQASSTNHHDDGLASQSDTTNDPVHHGRCSGPQCSGGSPNPLAPLPAPVKIVTTDWGMLAAPFAPAPLELRFVQFEDDRVRPLPGASTIYRPPR